MKEQQDLNKDDQATVKYFALYGKFGEAIQDKYLTEFLTHLSNITYPEGMEMPTIVCDPYDFKFEYNNNNTYGPHTYLLTKNTRSIVDMLNKDKDVYAFFNYPELHSSPLYIGTFNTDMRHMMLKGLEAMKANYKTTPVTSMPFTAKVDMASFATGRFSRINTGQTLEYIPVNSHIISPEQLFYVDDKDSNSK